MKRLTNKQKPDTNMTVIGNGEDSKAAEMGKTGSCGLDIQLPTTGRILTGSRNEDLCFDRGCMPEILGMVHNNHEASVTEVHERNDKEGHSEGFINNLSFDNKRNLISDKDGITKSQTLGAESRETKDGSMQAVSNKVNIPPRTLNESNGREEDRSGESHKISGQRKDSQILTGQHMTQDLNDTGIRVNRMAKLGRREPSSGSVTRTEQVEAKRPALQIKQSSFNKNTTRTGNVHCQNPLGEDISKDVTLTKDSGTYTPLRDEHTPDGQLVRENKGSDYKVKETGADSASYRDVTDSNSLVFISNETRESIDNSSGRTQGKYRQMRTKQRENEDDQVSKTNNATESYINETVTGINDAKQRFPSGTVSEENILRQTNKLETVIETNNSKQSRKTGTHADNTSWINVTGSNKKNALKLNVNITSTNNLSAPHSVLNNNNYIAHNNHRDDARSLSCNFDDRLCIRDDLTRSSNVGSYRQTVSTECSSLVTSPGTSAPRTPRKSRPSSVSTASDDSPEAVIHRNISECMTQQEIIWSWPGGTRPKIAAGSLSDPHRGARPKISYEPSITQADISPNSDSDKQIIVANVGAQVTSSPGGNKASIDHQKLCLSNIGGTQLKLRKLEIYQLLGGDPYDYFGMDGITTSQELNERCRSVLQDYGASNEFSEFYADVAEVEFEINTTLQRFYQMISLEQGSTSDNPMVLLRQLQEMVKNFNHWWATIDELHERSKKMPALTLDSETFRLTPVSKSLCSLETKELNIKEGDEITITDTSQPNHLKVRTKNGEEGYVPALCCLLPSPDRSALTAIERLRIQLLSSWVETSKKFRILLYNSLLSSTKALAEDWKEKVKVENSANKERIGRRMRRLSDLIVRQGPRWDLDKLHSSVFSLEREMSSWSGSDISAFVETVAALDKSVLCYQTFTKQLYLFRKNLEKASRPIRIMDEWNMLQPTRKGRKFRYYEIKMTSEEVETREEISEFIIDEESYSEGSTRETVTADQITSSSQEERKRFVVKCVIDPRNGTELSISDAVSMGIVDQANGMYINPVTGDSIPIPQAMGMGKIIVEQVSTTKTKEETKAIGLITIRTQVERRKYSIKSAVDTETGERLSLEDATSRGIIDEVGQSFVNKADKETISIDDAIQAGLVDVEYEGGVEEMTPTVETKTFAVSAVVDQVQRKKVPFYEAVRLGLIDRETGNYINNQTGEKIYVAEAIKRGFLKAKEVEDNGSLDIDAENRVVIDRMENLRKNVLRSVGVMAALKGAAGLKK